MSKILVVEDDAQLCECLVELLTQEGYDTYRAADGCEGVGQARRLAPDLVICDINMPLKDGYGVLADVRHDPRLAATPFVFLTAKTDRADIRRGMDLGADDYLTKPFTADEMLAAVSSRLQHHVHLTNHFEVRLRELRDALEHTLPHEYRTPLTVLTCGCELLIDLSPGKELAEQRELAQGMQRAARRLTRLVDNFLLYAHTESVLSDLERLAQLRNAQLADAGEKVLASAYQAGDLAGRCSDLRFEINGGGAAVSEDHLSYIVSELVGNACKFSEPGTPVAVWAGVIGDSFVLRVSNQGHGLTPEQARNVTAFRQFDRKDHEQQGCGLGLAIVRGLSEAHGGRLQIESEPGATTVVSVWLPSC